MGKLSGLKINLMFDCFQLSEPFVIKISATRVQKWELILSPIRNNNFFHFFELNIEENFFVADAPSIKLIFILLLSLPWIFLIYEAANFRIQFNSLFATSGRFAMLKVSFYSTKVILVSFRMLPNL